MDAKDLSETLANTYTTHSHNSMFLLPRSKAEA
jgi:hypothetical protein